MTAVLAAAVLALTACDRGNAETPQTAPSKAEQRPAAPEAARIGAAGSACEMPVAFGLAESWKPKPVTVAAGDPLSELARRGPLTMVCEIDAKPAGNIGYLRVWTGDKGELRPTLEAFIGTNAREPVFTELRIGGSPALEVVYQEKSQLDDTMEQERAFAVETAQGVAAVSLDSFDSSEHDAMLPAYELAKNSLTRS
ncbi:lipoprotein [Actinoplanes sp. NPDC049118]|uniref:lipoprotein n=1 Tax=Actinoplanes sp. NPDC049118 TaxID=3155769 RepID=UPI003400D05B